jgi:hypothetical protein
MSPDKINAVKMLMEIHGSIQTINAHLESLPTKTQLIVLEALKKHLENDHKNDNTIQNKTIWYVGAMIAGGAFIIGMALKNLISLFT